MVAPFSQAGPPNKVPWLSGPPVLLSAPTPGCPISVVAAGVASANDDDRTRRFATGWGATIEDATYGCLFEAAERFSAQFHGGEAIATRRADAFAERAILPPQMLLISDRQYADRRRWNAEHPGSNELPPPWRRESRIDWIAAAPTHSSSASWLPARLCFLGYPRDSYRGLPAGNSSGVAAGTTFEDAVIRAFVELVERDAVAIWWYNAIRRPLLDLAELGEPVVAAYADWSAGRGRHLRLHDLTHDLGIPVVAAVAHDSGGGAIAFGFAAAASPAAAARHAVGELAQFECNVALLGTRAEREGLQGVPPEARALLEWHATSKLADHPHLAGAEESRCPPASVPLDIARCRALCERNDLPFLVIDLSRPSVGVPVARVVVPGLRSMEARFAPGRLYDVPVRLGWRSGPIREADLNPTPLMF
jgi:ribosomal protein S12 methylthiotransferase accessory factor